MGKMQRLEIVVDFEVPNLDGYRVDGNPHIAEEIIRVGELNYLAKMKLTEEAPSKRGLALLLGSIDPAQIQVGQKLPLGLPSYEMGHLVVIEILAGD